MIESLQCSLEAVSTDGIVAVVVAVAIVPWYSARYMG